MAEATTRNTIPAGRDIGSTWSAAARETATCPLGNVLSPWLTRASTRSFTPRTPAGVPVGASRDRGGRLTSQGSETAAARFYRDAKILTLGEGTSEIMKLVISRQLGLDQ